MFNSSDTTSNPKEQKNLQFALQERILFIANTISLLLIIAIGITAFSTGDTGRQQIAIGTSSVVILSLILLKMGHMIVTIYMTIIVFSLASVATLWIQPTVTPELSYIFASFQVIAIFLSGLLAQQRSLPTIVGSLSIGVLIFHVVTVQGPAIGYTHIDQMAGGFAVLVIVTVLADQTYLLTGHIVEWYNQEKSLADMRLKKLNDIISVYSYNKESGSKLEGQTLDSDTTASQIQETLQSFIENMNELDQVLKDTTVRNESTLNATSNIMQVFARHKDGMVSYQDKVDQVSSISQEIDHIVQERKVHISELIEMSQQGGTHMHESVVAVEKVAENSKNMLDMISLIMEVAERTNILALNAAVEASRAGKAGGGFAIVAKEIKTLSTETTQNAEIINKTLQVNLKSITEAVDIIRNVGRSFVDLNTNIVDFSASIDDIVIRVRHLNQQNSQMSMDTKNAISLSSEVQAVLEKTLQSIDQGQSKIKELRSLSDSLSKNVSSIHQKTTTISDAGRKTQERYRAYTYSVKQVEDTVLEIEQQLKL